MKVKLTKDFEWYYNGFTPVVIPAGTIVDSPVAENALSVGSAVQVEVEQRAVQAAPMNKAIIPEQNKHRDALRPVKKR